LKPVRNELKEENNHLQTPHGEAVVDRDQVVMVHQAAVAVDVVVATATIFSLELILVVRKTRSLVKSVETLGSLLWIASIRLMRHTLLTTTT
jgi:hypothetical protein